MKVQFKMDTEASDVN